MSEEEGGTNQCFAIMSLPRGFSAFLRRLGMVTLARDERRLRFWSSRPIVCFGDLGFFGSDVGDETTLETSIETLTFGAANCDSKISLALKR